MHIRKNQYINSCLWSPRFHSITLAETTMTAKPNQRWRWSLLHPCLVWGTSYKHPIEESILGVLSSQKKGNDTIILFLVGVWYFFFHSYFIWFSHKFKFSSTGRCFIGVSHLSNWFLPFNVLKFSPLFHTYITCTYHHELNIKHLLKAASWGLFHFTLISFLQHL